MSLLERTWARLFGAPSKRGRDLRMVLAMHVTTPFDAFTQPAIEAAMRELSVGDMQAGKRVSADVDNVRVNLVLLGYEQTWDGEP